MIFSSVYKNHTTNWITTKLVKCSGNWLHYLKYNQQKTSAVDLLKILRKRAPSPVGEGWGEENNQAVTLPILFT
jgi:hypothetical protein